MTHAQRLGRWGHRARFRPLGAGAALVALSVSPLASGCLGRTRAVSPGSAVAAPRTPDAEVLKSTQRDGGIVLETSAGVLAISMPRSDTFRLHVARSRDAKALPSFALEPDAQALAVTPKIEESDALIFLRSERAMLRIEKNPLRIRLMNPAGDVIADDALRIGWQEAGARVDFSMKAGEHVFGLGDKTQGFDRRGHAFELWNTDAFGWKVDTDPLYKALPLLLLLGDGPAHAIFVDHPARASFDIGKRQADVISYEAKAGDAFDVYLFAGPEPKRVLEAYTALTGRTPLPPLWALGHHQSRYGYKSEAEVRGVIARLQKDKLPVDAVWLDIDYQAENAPFTVNTKAFPSFAKMVADLRAAGVKTITITDLHVKSYQHEASPGYAPYDTGAAGDHFIHATNGAAGFFEGPVWPGASVFPEFTRAVTRQWWGGLYRGFVEQGVAGFWNDMNEPSVFVKDKTFPDDVLHRLDDGTTAPHALIHNVYGMLNARATFEGVKKLRPDVRPFILTRAAYAGIQKYAASWTGDNTADRSHLALTLPQLMNLGVSGFPFNGADVGGFVGCPDAELFAEWMELGALQPFYRNHSAKESCRREPWLFGAVIEGRARKAIERRYRLLPYLYTAFEEASRNGTPVMRPLWLEYPNDRATYGVDNAYLLGRDLLVAPKLLAGAVRFRITLPAAGWYDAETLALVSGGEQELSAKPDDSVRLFVRAGAIIPEAPLVQNTREVPVGPLTLTVWPGPDCAGSLYLDDGESFAYQAGKFRRLGLACETGDTSLSLESKSVGDYAPWWKELSVVVHDVPKPPTAVTDANGKNLSHSYDAAKKTLVVALPGAQTDFKIAATW
jgi:alpha-glucosidase